MDQFVENYFLTYLLEYFVSKTRYSKALANKDDLMIIMVDDALCAMRTKIYTCRL